MIGLCNPIHQGKGIQSRLFLRYKRQLNLNFMSHSALQTKSMICRALKNEIVRIINKQIRILKTMHDKIRYNLVNYHTK